MFKSISTLKRKASVLERVTQSLNLGNSSQTLAALKDPRTSESPFQVNAFSAPNNGRNRTVSKLPNGVTVLTETPSLPGPITFGVLLNVGTRDETKETSGVLHSIHTTYYKSHLNTNETINFGMVQMSGGRYEMLFDREQTIFKATCLAHDTVDLFGMVSDCVLEPRAFTTANVGISKLPFSHRLQSAKQTHFTQTDQLLAACFGSKGLGMPYLGTEKNVINLNASTLQKFQAENIAPEKIVVAGLGVDNHGEFLELAYQFYGNLAYGSAKSQREASKFTEAEFRTRNSQAYRNELILAFESSSWQDPHLLKNFLARELFGAADVANPQCQEANRGLFGTQVYQQNKHVHAIESFNMHFSDAGLFGFRVQASPDQTNKAVETLAAVIKGVSKVSKEELEGAKRRLKRRFLESTGKDFQRVEELLKHQATYSEVRLEQFLKELDAISAQDLGAWLLRVTQGKLAVLAEGSDLTNLHSHSKIKELFK